MSRTQSGKERGAGLIVLIIVIAFLLAVGILLLFVTGTGPAVAANVRLQEQAFNAAESGFDEVWRVLNESLTGGSITDFTTLYRTNFGGQPGLDDPISVNYFRRLTDAELVADVVSDHGPSNPALFLDQPLPNDNSLTYTVFLINDEAMAGVPPNDMDCLVVCIGRAGQDTYARIEVVIEIQVT
jgi:hypothetical protein